jgi:hypothetical protein
MSYEVISHLQRLSVDIANTTQERELCLYLEFLFYLESIQQHAYVYIRNQLCLSKQLPVCYPSSLIF